MVAFTDTGLRAIPLLLKGQKTYWDPSLPSFGLRVSRASKAFVLKRRNRWTTIGRFPLLSLSQARQEAKRLLAEFTLGRVRPQALPYPTAVKLFLEEKGKNRRQRTVGDYERLLGRLPFSGQLSEIGHDEVARQLKKFTAPSEYNHILVALKVFFNWCVKRRYIEHNPTVGLSTHATVSRSRTLTDREIMAVWKATEAPSHFNRIVRLLLLTGCRCGEIAALQSSWFQQYQITIPSSITKNGREHTVSLGTLAISIVSTALSETPAGLLFAARGKPSSPFNGFSKSKSALDKISNVHGWTLHDLRRTFATRMAELAVPPHVIERLLNHVSGTVSGVAAIYNRAKYLEEMRAAVDKYEAHLLRIFNDPQRA